MAQAIGEFSPPANPPESEPYSFDFVNDLRPGDSLSGVVWSCTVASGTDPDPSSRLDGVDTILGTITTQRVKDTLANVKYVLTATATTALGDTLVLWAYLNCEPVGC